MADKRTQRLRRLWLITDYTNTCIADHQQRITAPAPLGALLSRLWWHKHNNCDPN